MTLPSSVQDRSDKNPPTILPRGAVELHSEPGPAATPRSKVKRGRKNVSRACQACRQRRIRCTAERPCQPCQTNNLECEDDEGPEGVDLRTIRVGPHKQKVFIQQKTLLDSLLQSIRDDTAENVLNCIKEGGSLGDIAQALKEAESLPQSSRMMEGASGRDSQEVEGQLDQAEPDQSEESVAGMEESIMSVEKSRNLSISGPTEADSFSSSGQNQLVPHISTPVWGCIPLISDEASRRDAFSRSCMSFRHLAHEQIANGASAELILSLDGIEMDLMFRERTKVDPHTVSTWACELLKTFDVLHLVVKFAAAEAAACVMRWLIAPTKENYFALPPASRPTKGQYLIPHAIGADIMVLPELRNALLVRDVSIWTDIVTSTTMEYNWPYSVDACLELATRATTGHGAYMRLSRAFTEHIRDLKNLSLDRAVLKTFPELEGRYRFHDSTSSNALEEPSGSST